MSSFLLRMSRMVFIVAFTAQLPVTQAIGRVLSRTLSWTLQLPRPRGSKQPSLLEAVSGVFKRSSST